MVYRLLVVDVGWGGVRSSFRTREMNLGVSGHSTAILESFGSYNEVRYISSQCRNMHQQYSKIKHTFHR